MSGLLGWELKTLPSYVLHPPDARATMESREILSLEEQAAIERAREGIFEHAARTYDLLPFGRPLIEDTPPIGSLTRTPVQKKSATLRLQLCELSASLFDTEAQHYLRHTKDEVELRLWLQPVAARIGDEVGRDALDSSQDFHCSKADRLKAISDVLNKRVNHWVGKKQDEIISRASGPRREEASPTPVRSGGWVGPIFERDPISPAVIPIRDKKQRHKQELNQRRGSKLRLLRGETGWTQVELAEACDWSERTVLRHENGQTRISSNQKTKYAEVLKAKLGRPVVLD